MKILITSLLLLANLLASASCQALEAAAQTHDHLRVRLISEQQQLSPGARLTLALVLEHEVHWHTYWQYPGDSGLPTKLKLKFDQGDWQDARLQWPVPEPLEVGGIHNVGYHGETWLLTDVALPTPAPKTLYAQATWLVCKEECIPGKAEFELPLSVAESTVNDPARLADFAKARDALPKAAPSDWRARFAMNEQAKSITFALEGDLSPLAAGEASLFVGSDTLSAIAPSALSVSTTSVRATRARHDAFDAQPANVSLLWVVQNDGARVGFQTLATPAPLAELGALNTSTAAAPNAPGMSFAWALLLAFGGGVILNLMPCVLPVLSIKVLGLISAGPGAIRAHAWAYSAGVVSSFVFLGVVLLALRQAGAALGWGFQLQSPWLVGLLSLLMFVMALSMSGLVHFGYGMASVEDRVLQNRSGHGGAFLTGVLACVVASPCTAPMMGSALGYALVQPALVSLSVLMALGLGLAAPMLVLAVLPSLAQSMPKPGAWMQTLKQVLAVPMYLSAIWLGWVLANQRGIDAFALLLVAATLLALGLVWLESLRFQDGTKRKALAWVLSLSALIPLGLAVRPAAPVASVNWQVYSEAALADARRSGAPVLVNMTAAWCVTCKLNERVAMSGDSFAALSQSTGTVLLKGDWTDQDAKITNYLQSFAASGVPLVVVYPRSGAQPVVLPQLLTPALVKQALEQAAK